MTLGFIQQEIQRIPSHWCVWPSIEKRKQQLFQVQNQLTQLISSIFKQPQQIFALYQQEALAEQAIRTLSPRLEEIIDEFMLKYYPLWWENIPLIVKYKIYQHSQKQLPDILDTLFETLLDHIDELLDFSTLVADQLRKQPTLAKNFYRILRLPPQLKNTQLAHFLVQEFLNPTLLIYTLFTGRAPSKAQNYIHQQLKFWLEGPLLKPALQWMLGFQGYLHFKYQFTEQIIELFKQPLLSQDFQCERMNRLQEFCVERLDLAAI